MSLPYQLQIETLTATGRTNRVVIEEIKQWRTTTKLPELCDEFIALALISCDNIVETTKEVIQAHFKCKNEAAEIFDDRDIDNEDLQQSTKTICTLIMPTRTESNDVVVLYRVRDTNYDEFHLLPIVKILSMHLEAILDPNPPDGVIVIIDMAGIGLMHLTRLKTGILRKFFKFLEEGLLTKLKGFYFLNANYVCEKVPVIIKMITSDKLVTVLKAFPPGIDMEQFRKNHVPAKCLPKEYGGDLPTCEELGQLTVELLRKSRRYFVAEEALRKSI